MENHNERIEKCLKGVNKKDMRKSVSTDIPYVFYIHVVKGNQYVSVPVHEKNRHKWNGVESCSWKPYVVTPAFLENMLNIKPVERCVENAEKNKTSCFKNGSKRNTKSVYRKRF